MPNQTQLVKFDRRISKVERKLELVMFVLSKSGLVNGDEEGFDICDVRNIKRNNKRFGG